MSDNTSTSTEKEARKKHIAAVVIQTSRFLCTPIPRAYIGMIKFSGLKEIGVSKNDGITEYWASQFLVSIDRNYKDFANYVLDGEYTDIDAIEYLNKKNDINSIDRLCINAEKDRIYPARYDEVLYLKHNANVYDSKYMLQNEYQRSKMNKHGDLFIEISETPEIDTVFPDKVINADDYDVIGNFRRKREVMSYSKRFLMAYLDGLDLSEFAIQPK